MSTEIANAVVAAGPKAQYDAQVKRLLGNKAILSRILIGAVSDFAGMTPEEAEACIEGDPKIDAVPVEPGLTNARDQNQRITGLNTESSEINEGLVRFDILFYARAKDGLSKIIVNVEAQKDNPREYSILNRAIFYASRLISSQKERDFQKSDFDAMHKVYSVWICMGMEKNILNRIHLQEEKIIGNYSFRGNLDLLNVVLVGIPKEVLERNKEHELHYLLSVLLSSDATVRKKLIALEECGVKTKKELTEEVENMCNLSEWVEEKAAKKATEIATKEINEKHIVNMDKRGYTVEQIADIVELSPSEITEILRKKKLV